MNRSDLAKKAFELHLQKNYPKTEIAFGGLSFVFILAMLGSLVSVFFSPLWWKFLLCSVGLWGLVYLARRIYVDVRLNEILSDKRKRDAN